MDNNDKNKEEEMMIDKEFDALIEDYIKSNHRRKVELITKAFHIAREAHKGARRRSGEPYIMHPIAVSRIVCNEIGLGSTSICAALLHDVVEDTDYTVDDIKKLFGDKIAEIVDGLTKISSGMFGDQVSSQAENFRKLLLTMSDDIRVILVKIADRLHNMRTLGSMAPAKRHKIAGETMYIYAPLAHRLGLFAIKTELEELSFKYENPEEYNDIVEKLDKSSYIRRDIFEHFAEPVKKRLDEQGFKYEIKARDKSVYSIWNKMKTKAVPFEEIYDIFAVRVIFESEPGLDEKKRCWDIYSIITDIYKLRPDRIRDWVSRPKSNGYQALHLTVMGPDGEWVEIQIRSRRMDDIAEKGFAAHWKYKEGKVEEDTELDKWLKTIKEILENPNPNAIDFLDTIKLNLFSQEIFVFTPKGDLKTMAQGATALDFAYELHSNIGDKCIGAKVNHKLVPLSHKLNSGDQVEILTSKSQTPQPEWLGFVTSGKARAKLETSLKKQKKEIAKQGEIRLRGFLGLEDIPTPTIDKMLDYYKVAKKEDLFFAVGNKTIVLPAKPALLFKDTKDTANSNFLMRYVRQAFRTKKKETETATISDTDDLNTIDKKKTYILQEDSFQKNFRLASCCNPIPGDKVFGFIGDNNEIQVHNVNCPVGLKLKASFGNKILNLEWGNYAQYSFLSTIVIRGIDRVGMLNDITKVIITDSVNIKNLNIESNDGIFEGKVSLFVHSVADVQKLCSLILKIEGVQSVNRLS